MNLERLKTVLSEQGYLVHARDPELYSEGSWRVGLVGYDSKSNALTLYHPDEPELMMHDIVQNYGETEENFVIRFLSKRIFLLANIAAALGIYSELYTSMVEQALSEYDDALMLSRQGIPEWSIAAHKMATIIKGVK